MKCEHCPFTLTCWSGRLLSMYRHITVCYNCHRLVIESCPPNERTVWRLACARLDTSHNLTGVIRPMGYYIQSDYEQCDWCLVQGRDAVAGLAYTQGLTDSGYRMIDLDSGIEGLDWEGMKK